MTKDKLEFYTIHDLRVLGRALGVKHPSMLNKEELIDYIILVSNQSIDKNYSKKGRKARAGMLLTPLPSPPLSPQINKDIVNKINEILDKARNDIINLLKNKK